MKDNPDSKMQHIFKFHPQVPMMRIARLFSPGKIEHVGMMLGEWVKRMVS